MGSLLNPKSSTLQNIIIHRITGACCLRVPACLQRIDSEVPVQQRGDMLVFVSGMADIVALAESMRQYAQVCIGTQAS